MSVVEPAPGTRAGDAFQELDQIVETSPERLTGLRGSVRRLAAAAGATPELSSDIELAVSELATNVIRHTYAESMRVIVRAERDGAVQQWTIQVENDVVPTPIDAELQTAAPTGGRGLRIVAAIMDDITVSERQGRMTIKASRAVRL
jgi:serine/threonine-protein kinase RsbW